MIKRIIGVISTCFLLFGVFSSCEEKIDVAPSIITEDVLYVSGERLRVSGRIITTQTINASDHGFYISENESFSQPVIISLGERANPGRFIGEISSLTIDKRYFVKAFVTIQDEIIFGNVAEVETLIPAIFSFSPNNGPEGTIVTISGKNLTSDTEVFFGSGKGTVVDISFESTLQVRVPPISGLPVVNIKVVNQEREISFETPFEYTTGKYTKLADFPSAIRIFDGISLQENDVFYVGMGTDRGQAVNNTMWKYQVGDNNWQEIPLPSRALWRAFSSKTYYGGGSLSPIFDGLVGDFYQLKNGQFLALNNLPFFKLRTVGFEIGGNLYVLGGRTIESPKEVFEYNAQTNIWRKMRDAPIEIDETVLNFTYGGKQYFIDPLTKDLLAFDPGTDSWEAVSKFPGDLGNGTGVGVVIGNRAYLGLGNRSDQMWELNMTNLNWAEKNKFTGSTVTRNSGVYVHGGLIYMLRSAEVQILGVPSEFWVFDPNGF
ncbi:IPT/TIG domain-containing protein [Shivajiella indica]|uniref:IPT/TIG domain-containing protein n=1 Tax=Shivajiella indica TaxID=872115 RepID=A0ABW5B8E8_9BACT